MHKLAKDYETTLTVYPKVRNSLSASVYVDAADNNLQLQIKAPGFFILRKKFTRNNSVSIDLKSSEKEASELKLTTISLKEKIADNFDKTVQITSIHPETIYYTLSGNISKKVPVVANFNITFKNEYRQNAPVQFSPDSVIVRGAQANIDSIKQIVLPFHKYDNVDKTIEDIASIVAPENVLIEPLRVKYKIPVARCTAGSVSVPIRVVNAPSNSTLVLLPSAIEVKYLVPVKEYTSVNSSDFAVEVDFKETNNSLNRRIKVNLVKNPSEVFDIKIEPAFVEFLIRQ